MSNRRRARQRRPDLKAGARLALVLSARRDGCTCTNPLPVLNDLDLVGGFIVGDVVHLERSCPLFAAGPAAPHDLADLVVGDPS